MGAAQVRIQYTGYVPPMDISKLREDSPPQETVLKVYAHTEDSLGDTPIDTDFILKVKK